MAERPSLHIAVAGQKNKASEYNDNFDMMMDYVEEACTEATDYVDDQVDGKANLTLSNVTSLSDAVKALLGNDYAKKDLSNITGGIAGALTADDKATISNLSMPNYSGTIVSTTANPYTAPHDGIYYGNINWNEGSGYVKVNNKDVLYYHDYEGEGGLLSTPITIFLNKGDVLSWGGTIRAGKFVRTKGGN